MSTLSPKQWFKFTVCTVVVVYLLSTFNLLDSDQHKYYQDDSTIDSSAMMLMHFSPVDYDYVSPPSPPESFLIPENRNNVTLTDPTYASFKDNDDSNTECRITSQVRVIISKPFWTMLAIDQHGNNFREGGDDFHVTFTESTSSLPVSPLLSEPEIAVAFVSDQENGSYRLEFVGTSPLPPQTTEMLLQPNSSTSTLLPANQSETIPTTPSAGTGILTVQILRKWRCNSRNHQQFLAIDQLLRHDSQKQRQRAASAHPTILTFTKEDVPMPPILGL
jgi:hypothetical protein